MVLFRSTLFFSCFALVALAACSGDGGTGGAPPGQADAGADAEITFPPPDPRAQAALERVTYRLPVDGVPNDNGSIGPFCCTGTTATVRDKAGANVGYVYFYGWDGQAYNIGDDRSAAPDVKILVSAAPRLDALDEAQVLGDVRFVAKEMKVGAAKTTTVGALAYTVTIEKVEMVPAKSGPPAYFDMGSLAVRVDVSLP